MTPEQERALDVARDLVRLGVPLFVAPPDPTRPTGFALPARWQTAEPSESTVDAWRPGWALGMVTGCGLDVVDLDPRNGTGDRVDLPEPLAVAETPSGGLHYLVMPLEVESRDGAWPGVDVKSGTPDGSGRGFAFIAPTVRRSKVDGSERPYRWRSWPGRAELSMTWDYLAERGPDSGGRGPLRQRILELRAGGVPDGTPRTVPRSVAAREWSEAVRRLVDDLRHWDANGWGGQAHAGLLAASTHLARLSSEHAEDAYLAAFAAAGVEPDDGDLRKLQSALERAVPDRVVDDAELPAQDRFWLGGEFEPPKGPDPVLAGPVAAERGGFLFLDEHELMRLPAPDPLVAGLLWQDSAARLFGPSSVGKTFVALDVAAHVARGEPWQGREVKQGSVLYVAAEGAPSIGPRLSAWRSYRGRGDTGIRTWPEPVQLGGPHWELFCDAVAELGPVLVVLDTQAAMTIGRKENDNDDAGAVLSAVAALARRTRACVLLVHHNGWADEGRARGASAMFAGLDTELQLMEGKEGVLLVSRKQRYAEKSRAVPLVLEPHDGALVVVGRGQTPDGFFGDPEEARARALCEVLHQDNADPGKSQRTLLGRLRELNHTAKNETMRLAVRMFQSSAGRPVNLGPEPEEGL